MEADVRRHLRGIRIIVTLSLLAACLSFAFSYVLPLPELAAPRQILTDWAVTLAGLAVLLGVLNATLVNLRRVQSQRVFGCHGTKRHSHDRVGTGRENVHLAVLNQLARRITDVVCERKTHTLRATDPILLHQSNLVRPTF